jgi:tetratricopeptide (TPR) repeat protein
MEFLQTSWTWIIEQVPILKTISSDITKLKWYELLGLIAALLAILVPIWAILKLITKPFSKKKLNPEISSSSAEEIAKAAISSYEKGKQTAEADLQAKDQQIQALTKAVEALQTERQEAETEAEQTTIDTALAHLKEGNPSEAEAIFEEILETQSKHGQQANKQAAAAARHIGALAFLHDTAKAHKAYKRATELDPDNAHGWNQLGHLQNRLGQLNNAIKSYETVLRLGNSSADQTLIAAALNNLGLIYQTQGDLEKAEDAQLKALKINEKLGNKQGMAQSYGNLGVIYKTQGDLEKAEEAQLKSLKINEQLGNKKDMAASYVNLGVIYQTQGDLEKAEDAQLKSLKIKEQLGNKLGIAISYGNLGGISGLKGNMSEACAHWQKALALFTEVGAKREMEQTSNLLKAANCPDINNPPSN